MNYRKMISDLGYTVSRGGFRSTTDDRLDRWYLDPADATTLDRRGSGFATLREAYETLRSRLESRDF